MKKLLSAGLCLSMFLLAGCQGQPQDTTLTITDQAGRELHHNNDHDWLAAAG